MTPVTLWARQARVDGELIFEHNHLEDGHCANDVPTPKHEIHKRMWAGGVWQKTLRHLTDTVPPVIVDAGAQ